MKARPDGLVRDASMGKELVVTVPPPVPAVVQDNACVVPVVPMGSSEPAVSSQEEVWVQPREEVTLPRSERVACQKAVYVGSIGICHGGGR